MKKDILIIGGGPAGIITALTARSVYPEKSVCLVKEIGVGVIPCAIPYMMATIAEPKQNIMGNAPLESAGVEIVVDSATTLDPQRSTVTLAQSGELSYDRLVIATGSTPVKPPIPGIEKKGVFVIEKSLSAMSEMRDIAKKSKNTVILGGGFIGAEFADELARSGQNRAVHLVEMLPELLYTAFDDPFCGQIHEELASVGVRIHTGSRAISINGESGATSVSLDSGETLAADMVIVGVGGKPNVTLAQNAGLRITEGGSIWVDNYMRTPKPEIFAVGDCALKRDFFTRKEIPVWLASTATAEARIAGTNLYMIRVLRQIQGTIAAFSTRIGNRSFGSAGLTRRTCETEGFRFVEASATAPDRHPGMLPGANSQTVKLIFADRAGTLLGGQVSGGTSVGELINAIAIGIQKRLDVRELDMMQIATHPLLTSAPTVHPLINAAHQALAKLRSAK
jgi:NADH oxidase (H2O2-forming)